MELSKQKTDFFKQEMELFLPLPVLGSKCFSLYLGGSKLIFLTGNGIIQTGNGIIQTGNGIIQTGNGIMQTGNIIIGNKTLAILFGCLFESF